MRIQICMNTIMIVLNLHRRLDGFNGELVSGLIVYNRQAIQIKGEGGISSATFLLYQCQ